MYYGVTKYQSQHKFNKAISEYSLNLAYSNLTSILCLSAVLILQNTSGWEWCAVYEMTDISKVIVFNVIVYKYKEYSKSFLNDIICR